MVLQWKCEATTKSSQKLTTNCQKLPCFLSQQMWWGNLLTLLIFLFIGTAPTVVEDAAEWIILTVWCSTAVLITRWTIVVIQHRCKVKTDINDKISQTIKMLLRREKKNRHLNHSYEIGCRRRHFWHATLRLRSAIHRHHHCCFRECKVVLFQILLV